MSNQNAAAKNFIIEMAKIGSPVTYLEKVTALYTYDTTSDNNSNHTTVATHDIAIRESEFEEIKQFNLISQFLPDAAGSFYHESMHAYLAMIESEGQSDFVIRGRAYYKDAVLTNGKVSDDENLLFTEALAEYADHRITFFMRAYTLIKNIVRRQGKSDPVKLQKELQYAITEYNKEMKKHTFGYINWKEHVYSKKEIIWTTSPLNPEMLQFMNTVILENKIPDNFADNKILRQLLAAAGIPLPETASAGTDKPISAQRFHTWKPSFEKEFDTLKANVDKNNQANLERQHERDRNMHDQLERQRQATERQRQDAARRLREDADRLQQNRRLQQQEQQREQDSRRQQEQRQQNERQLQQTEQQERERQRQNEQRIREMRETHDRMQRDLQERNRHQQELQNQALRARPVFSKPPALPTGPSGIGAFHPHNPNSIFAGLWNTHPNPYTGPNMHAGAPIIRRVGGLPFLEHR